MNGPTFSFRRALTVTVAALAAATALRAAPSPARVLVIYNANWTGDSDGDGVQDSLQVANYYRDKRGVPASNLLPLNISVGNRSYYAQSEAGTLFKSEMVDAITAKLDQLGPTSIDVLLFCYGVPITVGQFSTQISIDNVLMAPYNFQDGVNGPNNPYFDPAPGFDASPGRFDHASVKVSGHELYLTGRLDGPWGLRSALDQVDQALYAERFAYPGDGYYNGYYYVDSRNGQDGTGAPYTDAYLTADSAVTSGAYYDYHPADENIAYAEHYVQGTPWVLKWENTTTSRSIGSSGTRFSDGTDATHAPRALFYGGWYNFGRYNDVWDWLPGSVVCDLNSNSLQGSALRGDSLGSFGVGAAARGGTVVSGVVNEPYLTGHQRPNVLLYYMLKGYTFAESAALATPQTGWMEINIGDPLYAPTAPKSPVKDTRPPALLGTPAVSLTGTPAVAAMVDDSVEPEVAQMTVEYGPTTAYGETAGPAEGFWRRNRVVFPNLASDTLYHYRLVLVDPVGNRTTTGDFTFTTGDVKPVVTVTATDPNASEPGTDTGAFTVVRFGADTSAKLTVHFSLSGTATRGVDYADPGTSVDIPAGSTSAVVIIRPIDDSIIEPTETVVLTLASDPSYTVGSPNAGTVSIADNEFLPTVSLKALDTTASETPGDTGLIEVSRANGTTGNTDALDVMFTISGTATNGVDYDFIAGTVTIPSGSSTTLVHVQPIDDTLVEGTESVSFALKADAAYVVGTQKTGTVLIADNEPVPTVTVSVTSPTAMEEGQIPGAFRISRTGDTTLSLPVSFFAFGSATSGSDYEKLTSPLEIPAGAAFIDVPIVPIDDNLVEGNEWVELQLVSSPRYTIGTTTPPPIVTIVDNDGTGNDTTPPVVTISTPTDGAIVSGSVPIAATAADNVAVTSVTISVDGTLLAAMVRPPYSATWDAASASVGSHRIQVDAYDAAGNRGTATVTVLKPDPNEPTILLFEPRAGTLVTFGEMMSAAVSAPRGIASVTFAADNVVFATLAHGPFSSFWGASAAAIGGHVLTVTVTDVSGKTASDSVTVQKISSTPTVRILAPADGATVSGSVTVQAQGDNGWVPSSMDLWVDGTRVGAMSGRPFSIDWDAGSVRPGSHALEVRATGPIVVQTASATIHVIVPDIHPPHVVIEAPGDGETLDGPVQVNVSATDDGTIAGLTLLLDGRVVATASGATLAYHLETGSLAPGPHRLTARATDGGGNNAETSISVMVSAGSAGEAPAASNVSVAGRPIVIPFDVADPAHVRIRLFDRRGALARTLFDAESPPGSQSVEWDIRTDDNAPAASGVYLLRFENATSRFRRVAVVR